MSTASLMRQSGLISILAGMLYALAAVLHPAGEDAAAYASANWVPAHRVAWAAVLLMQLGLVGLYARQADKAGRLGLVGFVLAFMGTAFVGTIQFMAATIFPFVGTNAPALFAQVATPSTATVLVVVLGFCLGYILFGVATMRTGVLPRGSGLLLIIGIALFLISEGPLFDRALAHVLVLSGDVAFGLGLVWGGYALWSEKRENAVLRPQVAARSN